MTGIEKGKYVKLQKKYGLKNANIAALKRKVISSRVGTLLVGSATIKSPDKKPKVDYKNTITYTVLEKNYGTGIVSEHRFHTVRKWRFDFAIPSLMIAIEVEGGLWVSGRHNHPTSVQKDIEKYNEAAKMGWCVLRYTPADFRAGKPLKDIQDINDYKNKA